MGVLTAQPVIRTTPVTFGHRRQQRCFKSATVTIADYPAGADVPIHEHDFPSIMWTVSGTIMEVLEESSLRCGPFSVVFKAAGTPHGNRTPAGPARIVVVELLPALTARMTQSADLPSAGAFVTGGVPAALALRAMLDLGGSAEPSGLEIEDIAFELATGAAIRQPRGCEVPTWLQRIRDQLHDAPEERYSLSVLAAEAGVHPVYLARAFRRSFGCSLSECVHGRRLDLATSVLISTDSEVGRIGTRLGYYDHSHFTRFFKERTGLSPTAFRVAARARA